MITTPLPSKKDDEEFVDMVVYFWCEKGNPTRYSSWDEGRCARLLPLFYAAWKAEQKWHEFARMAIQERK